MPEIAHSIQISAAPDGIHFLVSTAQGFAKWWAADVAESAGAVELGFFNRATVYRLRLQPDTPPTRTEWLCETGAEWSGTRLIFQLQPVAKGTLLRFTHAGWAAATDYFVSCNTVWGELMFRLAAAAEGKSRGPLFLASSLAY